MSIDKRAVFPHKSLTLWQNRAMIFGQTLYGDVSKRRLRAKIKRAATPCANDPFDTFALFVELNTEMYRSGRNENDSKSFCP